MRSLERLLVAGAVVATAAVGYLIVRDTAQRDARARALARIARATAPPTAADSAFGDSILERAGAQNPEVRLRPSTLAAPERDAARIAWLLQSRTEGTYFPELLAKHDSMNFRWPDRRHAPMRVWVQELGPGVAGYDATYPQLVRDAFSAWSAAGVPIHFTFVTDSVRGDIHVTWIDRFDGLMTGRTRWAHDQHRWIVGGNILMALHMPDGRVLHANAVRAIALHEVGHLIGLDHTADTTNIMAARVLVPELSEADRSTARLVYSLPPGSLKAPR